MRTTLLDKMDDAIHTSILLVASLYLSCVVFVMEPLTLTWYLILAFNVWIIRLMIFSKSEYTND